MLEECNKFFELSAGLPAQEVSRITIVMKYVYPLKRTSGVTAAK
jgi:hypothetical protein